MAKPPALKRLQPMFQMVVRGQTEQGNREILEKHVLKWRQLQKPLHVLEEADIRTHHVWRFRGMFADMLLGEIGRHQRRQGRIATGKNRKYIKIAKVIENGGSVLNTKLSDLKQARAFAADHLAGWQEKLYRIDAIIAVAEELGVDVITNDVIEEADSRIAAQAS